MLYTSWAQIKGTMNNACCAANAEATRAVELARKKHTAEQAELPDVVWPNGRSPRWIRRKSCARIAGSGTARGRVQRRRQLSARLGGKHAHCELCYS